ncbi:pilus assembly protein [Arsenicicoccus piscis]|uniref:Pilus assembly protein TadE n=1 Tax=Arsenicicoccus piscis TaxID=673954 RepID=A0ABQ6HJF0_9MICO|nr:pilus assembly protein [Arsenicicoccus piscis]MCH8628314.1 pilus assembly protein [Arsenicicoccus piscis]GMA18580.1 hypothetical protein GCM10025862_06010 [Arsenicicoccus piscis]
MTARSDGARRRWLGRASDEGSASLEFIAVAVLLLVPLIYLIGTLARVQAATYAAAGAARDAGRLFVAAPDEGAAQSAAQAASRIVLDDYGFADSGTTQVRCLGSPCLAPDAKVQVEVRIQVDLPLIPRFVRGAVPLAIPVTASHVASVDRYGVAAQDAGQGAAP